MAEGSQYFSTVDGVLFNADQTVMIDYPKRRVADSYTIPSTVTKVRSGALKNVQKTKEIIVPNNVQSIESAIAMRSNYESFIFGDEVPISGWLDFSECPSLRYLHLPENATIGSIQGFLYSSEIESFKIPKGTKRIVSLGSGYSSLSEMIYDAENCTIGTLQDVFLGYVPNKYDLLISIVPTSY